MRLFEYGAQTELFQFVNTFTSEECYLCRVAQASFNFLRVNRLLKKCCRAAAWCWKPENSSRNGPKSMSIWSNCVRWGTIFAAVQTKIVFRKPVKRIGIVWSVKLMRMTPLYRYVRIA